jgi:uncharacterized protein (DUF4415 family)
MKKKTTKAGSKDVTVRVSQAEYERELQKGIKPDETLAPGVHKGRRGGFLERHPEALAKKHETKVMISIKLDRDILEFFKERAAQPNAAPYQTQINNALRTFMEGKNVSSEFAALVDNDQFISAIADRVFKERRRLMERLAK